MKRKTIFFLVFCFFAAISCKNHDSARGFTMQDKPVINAMNIASEAPPPPPPPEAIKINRYSPKLVKKGELIISTDDIESAKTLLYGFIRKCNGYVTTENLAKNDYTTCYDISLNIQASCFDLFLHLLDSARLNIVAKNFSVEDVSLNYIDDSTRLQNKKKLETRYTDLLSKTKDIKDVLEIEEKLEEIQSDIEVKESQLKLLDKQIAFSEFTVKIEKEATHVSFDDRTRFTYKLWQGIVLGWDGIKSVIVILFSIWPLYFLVAILIIVIKYFKRKRKQNKN
jgi:hypothetical protein